MWGQVVKKVIENTVDLVKDDIVEKKGSSWSYQGTQGPAPKLVDKSDREEGM